MTAAYLNPIMTSGPVFCLPSDDDEPPPYTECEHRSRRGSRASLYGLPDNHRLPSVVSCGTFLDVPCCQRSRRLSGSSTSGRPKSARSSPQIRTLADQRTSSEVDVRRAKDRRCSRHKMYGVPPTSTVLSVMARTNHRVSSAGSYSSDGSRKSAKGSQGSRSSLYGLHPSDSVPSVLSCTSSDPQDEKEDGEEEEVFDCRRRKQREDSDEEECLFHDHTRRKSGRKDEEDDEEEERRRGKKSGRRSGSPHGF